jgi:DNA invertase Pin-like site-specific DNA recombinase
MKVAYSYLRFSHPQQMKGDSRRRQLEWSEAVAARHGWLLDKDLHIEDLGVSAFKGKNSRTGDLARFLEAVTTAMVKPGSVLLVESLDRLSREEHDEAYDLFRGIIRAGVEIYTREPERHYTRETLRGNPLGIIEPILIMSRAHEESETKSMRGVEAWKARRVRMAKGLPVTRQRPAWVKVSADGKRFELVPEAAAAVRRVFLLAAEGLGIRGIPRRLNQEKVPAIGKLKAWGRSYVAKLLKDRRVLGEYQPHVMEGGRRVPHGPVIEGYFPAAVKAEEWRRARRAKGEGRAEGWGKSLGGNQGNGVPNLFTGLLKDARDGRAMHLKRHRRNGTLQFVSNGAMHGEPGSVYHAFPYPVFEEKFLDELSELRPADIVPAAGGPGQDREAKVLKQLGELEGKLDGVKQQIARRGALDTLVDVAATLEGEKKALEAERDAIRAEREAARPDALKACQSLTELLRKAPPKKVPGLRLRVKAALRWLVREIVVLVVPLGGTTACRLCACQVWFADGKRHRDYVILHRPAQGHGPNVPARPAASWVKSFADALRPGDYDLRVREDAQALEADLASLDLSGLA